MLLWRHESQAVGWGTDMTTDSEFYARRFAEERAAAETAVNAAIARRHTDLADLYEEKLKLLPEGRPRPRPTLRMAFDNTRRTAEAK